MSAMETKHGVGMTGESMNYPKKPRDKGKQYICATVEVQRSAALQACG